MVCLVEEAYNNAARRRRWTRNSVVADRPRGIMCNL